MARALAGRTWHDALLFAAVAGGGSAAEAQTAPAPNLATVEAEIETLEREQERMGQRIAELRRDLAAARVHDPAPAGVARADQAAPADRRQAAAPPRVAAGSEALARTDPAAPINSAGGSAPGAAPVPAASQLTVNGDLRLRYEANGGDRNARNRNRGVMRARLRAAYAVNDRLMIGGQLATGDPDDPNSTDITLSGFDDDLDVSLDQIYARLTLGDVQLTGGKIQQPLVRTELVWDGDVSPEGVAASYRRKLGGLNLRANALYFLVDESAGGPNSDMVGGQLAVETDPQRPLRVEFAASYLDYSLRSVAGADAGDLRNNRVANGRYLSDFNLLDVIGAVTWSRLGERWPVRVVADYVHNYGATVDADSGFGVDLLIGRTARRRDWRFGYGYAQVSVDAVLDAFSHDNTSLGSNYLQHSLSVDYLPATNVVLNATWYRYRPKSALYYTGPGATDWLDRVRLNLLVNF